VFRISDCTLMLTCTTLEPSNWMRWHDLLHHNSVSETHCLHSYHLPERAQKQCHDSPLPQPILLFPFHASPRFLQPQLHDSCTCPCGGRTRKATFVSPPTCAVILTLPQCGLCFAQSSVETGLFRQLRVYCSGILRASSMSPFHV
jgi:hypothetical protein